LTVLDINQIRKTLPHRYPFLLLDRVVEYRAGDRYLKAIKNVSCNEPFFQGHFPEYPVYPGVLMLEAIAQAAAVLASLDENDNASDDHLYLFAGVDKARFKRPIEPGDQMVVEVELVRKKSNVWRSRGQVKVDDALCCAAEVLFTYRPVP
jgi:3-hydroxyacyl-[acyl-carrier-protein] dehydratase